ncbi:MAG TPA: NAD(P)H-binding protein [Bacteroidia bacterium]|jgi:putative NADH-flavin reductase|nr:NAD(P)H-binding protein [Bacteroidia bacterium]
MHIPRIALFKATGKAGRRLAEEALKRGYYVTVIARTEKEFELIHINLKVVAGDVTKKEDIVRHTKGHDIVICAHEPVIEKPNKHVDITHALIEGVKESGIGYLISIGHAFSHPMENTLESYNEWKPIARAQKEALKSFHSNENTNWCYIHSVEPQAEEETGKFQISNDVVFSNSQGQKRVPIKNYASVLFDEIDRVQYELHKYEYAYEMGI